MTLHDDLATLRGTVADCQDVLSAPEVDRAMTALDRLEAERAAAHARDRLLDCIAANGITRAEAAEAALAEAREARRGIIATLIAVKGHLDQPYPDDPRWTPWTRFVEPALHRLDEALAGTDSRTA